MLDQENNDSDVQSDGLGLGIQLVISKKNDNNLLQSMCHLICESFIVTVPLINVSEMILKHSAANQLSF